jgi:diadenosine tetraphosphate (Ap4A) HIT family hydrolase
MPEAWSLHPQLEHDTSPVGDLPLCRVLAINDADYPWLVLVPRRAGVMETVDLDPADAARLMEEIALASRALKDVTRCDKLNIAAIGNVVPQLHVHIVARWTTDPLWPKPVWGHAPTKAGDAASFAGRLEAVRERLQIEKTDVSRAETKTR